jgi:hypothetical protein
MRRYILYIILLVGFNNFAQEVDFHVSAPQIVSEGERFQIEFVINSKIDDIQFPRFPGFQKIGGPYSSHSSNSSYINGQWQHNSTDTYTIMLYAKKAGTYIIHSAKAIVKGKEYLTEEVKIKVVKGAATQGGNSNAGKATTSGKSSNDEMKNLKSNIFIRPVVSKSKVYLGEEFTLTYKLYFAVNLSNVTSTELNTFSGFWSKNLIEKAQQYKQYEEIYNGKRYRVAELGKFALFPQKTGKIKIPAKKIELTAQIRRKQKRRRRGSIFDSFFDDPFFSQMQNVDVEVYAPPVTITVKNLPEKGKPASFKGAVGNFTMTSNIDKENAKTNDAITLKVTIKGKGNIELFDGPKLNFPPDFEIYDPKIDQRINTSEYGISGTKTFEYLIIPRSAGDYKINASDFTYFNPNRKKYITLHTPEYNLHIEKSNKDDNISTYQGSSGAKQEIKTLHSDIHHIYTHIDKLQKAEPLFWGSAWFYFFLFFPIAAFIIFTVVMKKELKKRGNRSLIRTKRATGLAKNRLKKSEKLLKENNKEAFYEEVSEALWGYLSDKFSIPLSQLSMATIENTLTDKQVSDSLIERYTDLLNHCEYSRYAPVESDKDMTNVYQEAIALISDMEKELK